MVIWKRGHNEMLSWQDYIIAAEAHYFQLCFVFQEGVILPSMTSPLFTLATWQLSSTISNLLL